MKVKQLEDKAVYGTSISALVVFGILATILGGNSGANASDEFALQNMGRVEALSESPFLGDDSLEAGAAGLLSAGTYSGRRSDGQEYALIMSAASGRKGSFLATLVQGELQRVFLYVVDPIDETSYSMTPLSATEDGEVGVPNDEPTLVLVVGARKKDRLAFTVTNSNSGNSSGFQGMIRFDGNSANLSWEGHSDGHFELATDERGTLDLSPMGSDLQSKAVMDLSIVNRSLSGNFSLREKLQGIFTLTSFVVNRTGPTVEIFPKFLVVFIRRGRGHYLVLLPPKSEAQILTLKRK